MPRAVSSHAWACGDRHSSRHRARSSLDQVRPRGIGGTGSLEPAAGRSTTFACDVSCGDRRCARECGFVALRDVPMAGPPSWLEIEV